MTIQIVAKPAIFLGVEQAWPQPRGAGGRPRRRSATTLMAKPRNGSSGKRSAQRERDGQRRRVSDLAQGFHRGGANIGLWLSFDQRAQPARSLGAPRVAHEIACEQAHVRVRVGQQLRQVWPARVRHRAQGVHGAGARVGVVEPQIGQDDFRALGGPDLRKRGKDRLAHAGVALMGERFAQRGNGGGVARCARRRPAFIS